MIDAILSGVSYYRFGVTIEHSTGYLTSKPTQICNFVGREQKVRIGTLTTEQENDSHTHTHTQHTFTHYGLAKESNRELKAQMNMTNLYE